MSEQDQQQRDAALDRMMAEGQQLVDQAREVAGHLDETLGEFGDKNAFGDFLEADDCPEELSQMAQEDLEKLMWELEQEEQAMMASESRGPTRPKSPRKARYGMNKI